ncbi:hypothetical protein BD311DRAFT_347107 [Dichomitus squalens]|uniref:Uncharacterized protein n=1 Tax=Dichomitus squalens TaxID=114155 RepID=A0A4Q9N564_9APHY|nr:hypothetical protein BD311DRAFT_347107 [Dichomitus squalens]
MQSMPLGLCSPVSDRGHALSPMRQCDEPATCRRSFPAALGSTRSYSSYASLLFGVRGSVPSSLRSGTLCLSCSRYRAAPLDVAPFQRPSTPTFESCHAATDSVPDPEAHCEAAARSSTSDANGDIGEENLMPVRWVMEMPRHTGDLSDGRVVP